MSQLVQVTEQIFSQLDQIIVIKENPLKLVVVLKCFIWKILQIIITEPDYSELC